MKRKRDAGYEPGKTKVMQVPGLKHYYDSRARRRQRIKQLAEQAPDGLAVHWPTLTVHLRKP